MIKFLVPGVVALALATTAAYGDDRKDDDKEPASAQNIESDERAKKKARDRDRRRGLRRAFNRGREVRSIDGSGNNGSDPLAGASFQQLQRLAGNDYADGISAMAGPLRKSAREISNILSAQEESLPNQFHTSDFLWQWGQFLDHDIDLTDGDPDGGGHDIAVPTGDRWFDPHGAGGKVIPFNRAIYDPATGTDLSKPREQINEITSWIDGSMIYGSSDERAAWLRTNDGTGQLKTSQGQLLPFNIDGLPNANGPAPDPTKLFLAGDVRANEQVGLATMHTLFVREHNRWARHIKRTRPHFSGEDVYQAARRMVIAEIQIITYKEFLPALLGPKWAPRYRRYTPGDPTVFNEFSAGAYRLGHSMINEKLLRLNRRGKEIRLGHLPLRDAFFNAPSIITKRGSIDAILRGLAAQKSQRIDTLVVDDLRNFLFGPPGAGGFDLASLNIQRGRDHGLPSYNDMRAALGLGRVSDFDEITSNENLQDALYRAYGHVDHIDLWIGGLAEDPLVKEGSQLGPTLRTVLARQFVALRDHDRFWFKRDLTRSEWRRVKDVTLAQIIVKNTGVRAGEIPRNVFYVSKKKRADDDDHDDDRGDDRSED